jgi:DNA-binding response OmpR family regulator
MDSTLVECRPIGGLHLLRNDHAKSLVVGNNLVQFTPMEYSLLCHLLDDEMVPDATLIATLFGSNELDKAILKNLEKHVERAKGKLKPIGLYIRRVHCYGYSLVRTPATTALAS